ncbi:MAG: hypothetical protein ABIR84_06360 [Candidatus Nitrotoga sp.]
MLRSRCLPRPIVMMTVAMAAGMLPAAMALGEASNSGADCDCCHWPFNKFYCASLVLVPVVSELIYDFEMWIKPKLAKFVVARKKLAWT